MTHVEIKPSFLPQCVLSTTFINTVLSTGQWIVKPSHDFQEEVHTILSKVNRILSVKLTGAFTLTINPVLLWRNTTCITDSFLFKFIHSLQQFKLHQQCRNVWKWQAKGTSSFPILFCYKWKQSPTKHLKLRMFEDWSPGEKKNKIKYDVRFHEQTNYSVFHKTVSLKWKQREETNY